jgi:hypothetical protein
VRAEDAAAIGAALEAAGQLGGGGPGPTAAAAALAVSEALAAAVRALEAAEQALFIW